MAPTKFLENIVILCFEKRFSKQSSVIRLKHLGRPQIYGLATPLLWWFGWTVCNGPGHVD